MSWWRRTWPRLWVVLLSLALVASPSAPAMATSTTVSFPDFTDVSKLIFSGYTATYGNPVTAPDGQKVIQLTRGLGVAGGAFLKDPVPLEDAGGFRASFSTAFDFQIMEPTGCVDTDGVQGADGLVFVVQTASNKYGGAGVGIGYEGIPKSVGVEFDTWNNGSIDRNSGNHVGIDVNGNINSLAIQHISEAPMNNQQIWHAWVDYNGDTKTLEVRVTQSATRPANAALSQVTDLPAVLGQPNAYVGFTSGTGCAGGRHMIRSWQFTNTFNPIGVCDDGLTWKAPLSASAAYSLKIGDTLPIAFQFCSGGQFVHDESVIVVVTDRANPDSAVSAWVYGSDIVIDDAAKEYSQAFDSGQYGLLPGQVLDVQVFMSDQPVGSAEVHTVP